MQERRHEPRVAVDLNCTVRLQDGGEITAKLIDLSCSGAGILTTSPLPLHSHVQICFSLAGYRNAHRLTIPSTVIHNFNAVVIQGNERQTGHIVGVDFAPLEDPLDTILCDYVTQQVEKTER